MPKPRKDPYRERPCQLCTLRFKPTTKHPKNADEQKFCCDSHRKEFWKQGKLPMRKLELRLEKKLEKQIRQIVREELATQREILIDEIQQASPLYDRAPRVVQG